MRRGAGLRRAPRRTRPGRSAWSLTDRRTSARDVPSRWTAASTSRRGRRQRPDAERELAVEPRLDVGGVGLLAVRGVLDQLVEDLVELGVERGLVGEARELGQELAGGLRAGRRAGRGGPRRRRRVRRDVAEDGRGRDRPVMSAATAAEAPRTSATTARRPPSGRGRRGAAPGRRRDRAGRDRPGRPRRRRARSRRRSRRSGRRRQRRRRWDVPVSASGVVRGRYPAGGVVGAVGRCRFASSVIVVPFCRLIAGPSMRRGRPACRRRRAAS